MKAKLVAIALFLIAATTIIMSAAVAASKPTVTIEWIDDTPPDFEAIVTVNGLSSRIKAVAKPGLIYISYYEDVV